MNKEPLAACAAETKSPLAGKYLTFNLGAECCGIPVVKVREIIRHIPPTLVPQMPDYVSGVINLRGKIIPVVDFRLKLGVAAAAVTEHTCIIVAQIRSCSRPPVAMGIVVDSVDEVCTIPAGAIEPTPEFGVALDVSFLVGMAKLKTKVVSLLDLDNILGTTAARASAAAAKSPTHN